MDAITTQQWIEASINIMETSMFIGARLYPFIMSLGLIHMIVINV